MSKSQQQRVQVRVATWINYFIQTCNLSVELRMSDTLADMLLYLAHTNYKLLYNNVVFEKNINKCVCKTDYQFKM
jgi:hypothetical protein